jgi:DNA polymerase-3 subunit alpha
MKRFYPVEFMAALLTTSSDSTEDVVKYIHEARTTGIEVLAPDVNLSARRFTVDYEPNWHRWETKSKSSYGKIRMGLEAVKGLGDAAIDAVLLGREAGPFESLYNFCEHAGSSKKVVEALIKSGAMDSFERPRRQLFESVERAIASAQRMKKDSSVGQTNMFGLFTEAGNHDLLEEYEAVGEWPERQKLESERESLGLYLSGHPLDRYASDIRRLRATPSTQLTSLRHLENVRVAGLPVDIRERPLKSGDGRWAIITLEDNFGRAEVLCFNKTYATFEELLKKNEPLLIEGRVLLDDIDDEGKQATPKMRMDSATSLRLAQIEHTKWIDVHIALGTDLGPSSGATFDEIHSVCVRHQGDKRVRFILELAEGYTTFIACGEKVKVNPNDEFLADLEGIANVTSVSRM